MNKEKDSCWIGLEVITEGGETLGWSRQVIFDKADTPVGLVITPIRWLPAFLSSTYELPFDEIAGDEPICERWVAYEGAETALAQLTVGWLERIGFSIRPWDSLSGGYVVPVSFTEGNDDDDKPDSFPYRVPNGPGPTPLAGEAEP